MASPGAGSGLPSWVHFCLLSPPVSPFDSPRMARLVFDIETSALPIETFDDAQQEYLFREANRLPEGPARDAKRAEIQNQFNLWPFTARVICIAMLNVDTARGKVLFVADDYEEETEGEPPPVEFIPCMDEVELLSSF